MIAVGLRYGVRCFGKGELTSWHDLRLTGRVCRRRAVRLALGPETGKAMQSADAAAAFAALGHSLRIEVWRMLLECGSLGLPAGTIAARLAVAPSSLSFHLQQMIQGHVLLQRRCSRQIIYMINDDVTDALRAFLSGREMIPTVPIALGHREAGDIVRER